VLVGRVEALLEHHGVVGIDIFGEWRVRERTDPWSGRRLDDLARITARSQGGDRVRLRKEARRRPRHR
jgi:hypothetical protein